MTGDARSDAPADQDFILTCYEVLLGRELDTFDVVRDRAGWPKAEVVQSIVGSSEFIEQVLPALETGFPFIGERFQGEPTLRQRLWAAEQLPIGEAGAHRVRASRSWRDLLTIIVSTPDLANL